MTAMRYACLDATRPQDGVENVGPDNNYGTGDDDKVNKDIAKVRVARKLACNQKKRQRVKRALENRRKRTNGNKPIKLKYSKTANDKSKTQFNNWRNVDKDGMKRANQVEADEHELALYNDAVPKEPKARYLTWKLLPTARMKIDGVTKYVKLDSGARFTIAGTSWVKYGDRVSCSAPVDYVEGIGGFLLDVLGVWRFHLENVFGDTVCVDACIVKGCYNEFLVGVDFMNDHGAVMDFRTNELKYEEEGRPVVIPFKTSEAAKGVKVAAVRMARKTQVRGGTVMPIEIAVTGEDGEKGIFIPTVCLGSILLATTMTEVRDGKAVVPAINASGGRVKLPSKKEIGTWIPIEENVEILEMNGVLQRDQLLGWLRELGDGETPLENEDELQIGIEDEGGRELMKRLLRVYRSQVADKGDCPPATTLDVEHQIETGDEAPILLKRKRLAQMEDTVGETNVKKMLGAGVIEEGNGAWGFPVVLPLVLHYD
ncbi:hypothetical protein PInf_004979 [Phytophthora infestans]|nr:hypothetical protein PInf_004979 [Phytophthora infestans]